MRNVRGRMQHVHVGSQHLAGARVNGFPTMQGWKYWESSWNSSFTQVFHETTSGISSILPALWLWLAVVAFVELSNRSYDCNGAVRREHGSDCVESLFLSFIKVKAVKVLRTSDLSRCLRCWTRTPGGLTCTSGDRFSRRYQKRSNW